MSLAAKTSLGSLSRVTETCLPCLTKDKEDLVAELSVFIEGFDLKAGHGHKGGTTELGECRTY